jgi:hypothetical protein
MGCRLVYLASETDSFHLYPTPRLTDRPEYSSISPLSSTTKMFQHHQNRQNSSAADSLLFTPFPSGRGRTLDTKIIL